MTKVKIKITGALMAFALVASVLVGGVGAPEANAAIYGCSFTPSYTVNSYGEGTAWKKNISCTGGAKAAAYLQYWTSSATNAKATDRKGKFEPSGKSSAGLPTGGIRIGNGGCVK
jgi:hypothetical protein